MRTAYSYIRFSSKAQEDGDSLRRQKETSEAYCKKNNLKLDNSFKDLAKSGFTKRNGDSEQEALNDFIELCENGEIKDDAVLIVENLDRLSRDNVKSALQQFLKILDYVDVYTLQDDKLYKRNSTSIDFDLIISITIMSRAHEESSTKSKRLSHRWDEKRKNINEIKATSNGPHWLKLDKRKNKWIPVPSGVEVIELIYKLGLDNSVVKIVKHLNDKGYKSPRSKSGLWAKTTVTRILQDKSVLGEYQPHIGTKGFNRVAIGEPIKDYYPQIISQELFDAVQAAKESRKLIDRGRGTKKFSNLLRNIAICKLCGSPMEFEDKGKKPKGGQYLTCSLARKAEKQCSNKAYVSYPEIEKAILLLLARKQLINNYQKSKKKKVNVLAIEGKKIQKEKDLKKLLEVYEISGSKTNPKIIESISNLSKKIDEIDIEVKKAKAEEALDKTEINLDAVLHDIMYEENDDIRVKNRRALNKFLIENLGKAKVACINPDVRRAKKRIIEIVFNSKAHITIDGYRYVHLNNTTGIDLEDEKQAIETIKFHNKHKSKSIIPIFKE